MVLFEVPGWDTPKDGPSITPAKKRKRPSADGSNSKLIAAEVNLEKLIEKLDAGKKGTHGISRKGKKRKSDSSADHVVDGPHKSNKAKMKGVDDHKSAAVSHSVHATDTNRRKKRKSEHSTSDKPSDRTHDLSNHAQSARKQEKEGSSSQLTSLQENMKKSLDGARFRWINETLYKSDSKRAVQMMSEDPKVYEDYHIGFRHQVTSWPSNPVSQFISSLSTYPQRSVIVDLGCGDAAIAQSLIPKGFTVLSYDLIAPNSFVISADICDKLPLPGAEGNGHEGQIVDVVVCSLSLMNTNWLNCIREARRVLKPGGDLRIAEVTSRIKDVKEFTSVVSSVGFRLVSKDDQNTHFITFEFKKSEGRSLDEKAWQKLFPRSVVLNPCEYKRR